MSQPSPAPRDPAPPVRTDGTEPAIPVALLSRALALLHGEWRSSGAVRRLDPGLVLAEAWAPTRLARAREKLAAGEAAPPIKVVAYRIGRSWVRYGVEDGMHRTVAHREAGRKVKARISGNWLIDPRRHVIWRDHLWITEGQGLRSAGTWMRISSLCS